jgi:hypothetical protein
MVFNDFINFEQVILNPVELKFVLKLNKDIIMLYIYSIWQKNFFFFFIGVSNGLEINRVSPILIQN